MNLKKHLILRIKLTLFILLLSNSLLFAQNIAAEAKIYVVFRNDDICALNDVEHEKKIMALFEEYNIPQTVGVIPYVVENSIDINDTKFHLLTENEQLFNLLKDQRRRGLIEIALHGYTHQTNRFHANLLRKNRKLYSFLKKCKDFFIRPIHHNNPYQRNGSEHKVESWKNYSEYQGISGQDWFLKLTVKDGTYSEFKDLPYPEQFEKINKGKLLLEKWFDAEVVSFIPPFNSHDENTIKACESSGLKIFSSQLGCKDKMKIDRCFNVLIIGANSCLRNFESDLKTAKNSILENNSPIVIVVLYHSWMYNSEEKISLLKKTLKTIRYTPEIEVITFRNLLIKYPQALRNFTIRRNNFVNACLHINTPTR